MMRQERAKQFIPFAALKGYPKALEEKEKIIVPKKELASDYLEELNWELKKIHRRDMVTAIYFCQGEYRKITGLVANIDSNAKMLTIVHTDIPLDDLYAIQKDET